MLEKCLIFSRFFHQKIVLFFPRKNVWSPRVTPSSKPKMLSWQIWGWMMVRAAAPHKRQYDHDTATAEFNQWNLWQQISPRTFFRKNVMSSSIYWRLILFQPRKYGPKWLIHHFRALDAGRIIFFKKILEILWWCF